MAVALSGAPQHIVGMAGSRHVVAVNKDRSAPIFAHAELGVVAEARTFLKAFLENLDQVR